MFFIDMASFYTTDAILSHHFTWNMDRIPQFCISLSIGGIMPDRVEMQCSKSPEVTHFTKAVRWGHRGKVVGIVQAAEDAGH